MVSCAGIPTMLNIVLARYGYSCRTAPSSSLTGKGKFQYTSLALIFGCDFLPVGTVISSSGHTLAVCKIRHFIYPQKLLTQIIGMLMCDRAIVDLRDVLPTNSPAERNPPQSLLCMRPDHAENKVGAYNSQEHSHGASVDSLPAPVEGICFCADISFMEAPFSLDLYVVFYHITSRRCETAPVESSHW